jgi:hypothetical protein
MTIQLEFTPEIIAVLNRERYRHFVPLVQRRMEALWLKSHGLPHCRECRRHWQIAELVGVTENTLREYFEMYQAGGIEKLKEVTFYRPQSELETYTGTLEAYFQANPPATIKEAQSEIEALTGVRRSETQVREFLKKNCIYGVAKSG